MSVHWIDMSTTIKNIVVVGGGTAGWLSACILAKQLNCSASPDVSITLIESADIPPIGVGEGTVPTMRETLQLIGVDEADFIKSCDVTFKQSIQFNDWLHAPTTNQRHSYHHLFNYPHTPGFDLTPYWLMADKKHSYSEYVSFQTAICELNLGPKRMTDRPYQSSLAYAYHLDAGKFASFLAEHGQKSLGIKHVFGTIADVSLADDGSIHTLFCQDGRQLSADFYVDCSGFSARLISETLKVKFVDKGDQLLVDRALALQVPYSDSDKEIPPFTISTAHEAGWTWDIGLTQRRGVGYVYSSSHTSDERAEQILRQYIGEECAGLSVRKIQMKIGYREKFWHKNCVAIGLAAGFVEPLEATALLTVEATAKLLAEKLPTNFDGMAYAEKSFNSISRYAWDRVIDFIKLHYYLSKRTDHKFWLDNTDPSTAPDSLLEKLAYWQYNLPSASDFASKYEVFQLENYQYVLYGMDFKTQINDITSRFPYANQADIAANQLSQHAKKMSKQLQSHRKLINNIKQYGINKI